MCETKCSECQCQVKHAKTPEESRAYIAERLERRTVKYKDTFVVEVCTLICQVDKLLSWADLSEHQRNVLTDLINAMESANFELKRADDA